MGVQTGVLVVLAGMVLADVVTNSESDAARSVSLATVVLGFAVGAGFLTMALLHGSPIARTPTLLWNIFVVLIGLTLGQGGASFFATGAVVLIGVLSLVAGWMATVDRS